VRVDLPDDLVKQLVAVGQHVEPIERCINAIESGTFIHPDGRQEELGNVRLGLPAAALLSHLCVLSPTPLSVEIGFGMGSSAAIILGMQESIGGSFEHIIFDPYGLQDNAGAIVHSYLAEHFGERFKLIRKRSEIGLAHLLDTKGSGCAGLIFIDGGHRFESVMTDFVLADLLCAEGGFIVLDDAWFPAIETVVNYVAANRPDYAVSLPVDNTCVMERVGPDRRDWCSFQPFCVPNRSDWTAQDRTLSEQLS
jgi:hypothetical protein